MHKGLFMDYPVGKVLMYVLKLENVNLIPPLLKDHLASVILCPFLSYFLYMRCASILFLNDRYSHSFPFCAYISLKLPSWNLSFKYLIYLF